MKEIGSLAFLLFCVLKCGVFGDDVDVSNDSRPPSFLSKLTGQMDMLDGMDNGTADSTDDANMAGGRQMALNPPDNVDATPGPFLYSAIEQLNPFANLFQSNSGDSNNANSQQQPIVLIVPVPVSPQQNGPYFNPSMYEGNGQGMQGPPPPFPPRGMMPFGRNNGMGPYPSIPPTPFMRPRHRSYRLNDQDYPNDPSFLFR